MLMVSTMGRKKNFSKKIFFSVVILETFILKANDCLRHENTQKKVSHFSLLLAMFVQGAFVDFIYLVSFARAPCLHYFLNDKVAFYAQQMGIVKFYLNVSRTNVKNDLS